MNQHMLCTVDNPPEQHPISSPEDLEKNLRRLLKQRGSIIVELQAPSGETLVIGLGYPLATVHYVGKDGMPPYLSPVVNPEAPDGFCEFDAGGTMTEIPLRHCMPLEKAIEIARYFMEHGELPQDVAWEEV